MEEHTISMNLNYRDKLPAGISQSTVLYLSSSYFGILSSKGVYSRGNALYAGFKVSLNRYFFDKKLKWNVSYGLNATLSSSASLYSRSNIQHRLASDLSFSIGEKWRFELAAVYFVRDASGLQSDLVGIDLDVEYALKKGWYFIFHGRGINRLRSRTFFYVEQTEHYMDYRSYQTYPGYVGVGVRKDF